MKKIIINGVKIPVECLRSQTLVTFTTLKVVGGNLTPDAKVERIIRERWVDSNEIIEEDL